MPTNFLEHLRERERSLIATLTAQKLGITNAVGKGTETERVVTEELIAPNLPPNFRCLKGAVVTSDNTNNQSPTIDRIIFDASAANPLIYFQETSIFPIEAVAGLVEITMHLDKQKLRQDVEHMTSVGTMGARFIVAPHPALPEQSFLHRAGAFSPRCFVVGLPASPSWSVEEIARTLREIQKDLGPPTHIHGLYVLGVGCFQTLPDDRRTGEMYRIRTYKSPEALFRFTTMVRTEFDRWPRMAQGSSVYLDGYLQGAPGLLSDGGYFDEV